jgi:FkbM family methyltransferase
MEWYNVCKRVLSKFYHGKLRLAELSYCESLRFSQFGEDVFLDQFFLHRQTGFYVDVGAFHPYSYSNTYLFYRRGWRGINIEPNPKGYAEFLRYRPRDVNLNCAVSSDEKQVSFTCDGVFSGINDDTHLYRDRNPNAQQITVQSRPLAKIFDQHVPPGTHIDYLSVDCEGHDLEVLRSNDWSRYRPRVLLVEDHEKRAEVSIDEVLSKLDYAPICKLRLTKVFVDQTYQEPATNKHA